ncbi:MAG: hypothetical protein KBT60_05875, partial [Methyloceanibacter sp.]|nr:hypothetical protein [Methyloceanibacter sp.]
QPSNRSDRPGKMQENQWPRNPVLTFWQSKQIYSDNAWRWRQADRNMGEYMGRDRRLQTKSIKTMY